MEADAKTKKLHTLAKEAAAKAYSPYSKVKVGSAVEGSSGKIYCGCNIENSSFSATLCAERVAIFKAISEGETSITRVYVYTLQGWPPCGCCRQVMMEFASPDLPIILGDGQGQEKHFRLKDLLPMAFGPAHMEK